jgi:hypothetical protein
MNVNSIINMIIRQITRRVINKGIDKSIKVASRKPKTADPKDRRDLDSL